MTNYTLVFGLMYGDVSIFTETDVSGFTGFLCECLWLCVTNKVVSNILIYWKHQSYLQLSQA